MLLEEVLEWMCYIHSIDCDLDPTMEVPYSFPFFKNLCSAYLPCTRSCSRTLEMEIGGWDPLHGLHGRAQLRVLCKLFQIIGHMQRSTHHAPPKTSVIKFPCFFNLPPTTLAWPPLSVSPCPLCRGGFRFHLGSSRDCKLTFAEAQLCPLEKSLD